MTKKLLLHFAFIGILFVKTSISFSQTLAPGDIAFIGLNENASTVNGTASNKDFSFILLKNITSGTIIYFTDFGWRSDSPAFQTALPCPSQPSGSGSITDGVLRWTATSNLDYGTQIVIRCQYAPTTNIGTVTGFQPTYNSTLPSSTALQYLTMSTVGESIFAYQGNLASPNLIAGMNASTSGWAATLTNCEYNPTPSTLPSILSTNNYAFTLTPASGLTNMQLKPGLTIPATASEARALIANKSNWDMSGTPYVMPAANPLPVRLISLNANTNDNGDVLLKWQVAEAVNFSGFQVEKSFDAKTFSPVAEIGYQQDLNLYSFIDKSRITHSGLVYYRLRMKDTDGSFAFSQILKVNKMAGDPLKLSAYPNPFSGKVEVMTDESETKNVLVTLSNSKGIYMISRNIRVNNNKITLEITEQLPAGIYILSINTSMGIQKIKMLKNP